MRKRPRYTLAFSLPSWHGHEHGGGGGGHDCGGGGGEHAGELSPPVQTASPVAACVS